MTVSASAPAAGGGAQAISPSDEALTPAVKELREAHPALGVPKLLAQLKSSRPEWLVSEKRLRKVLASLASPPSREVSTGAEATGEDASKADLVAATGLDPSIDVGAIAPKVKVKMFGHGKGKGLVAREKILQGEVVWQEEPWIVTADPQLYPPLLSQQMCATCFTIFSRRFPPLSVSCPNCNMAHFCNRLCLFKCNASAAHHYLLCPAQNPLAVELLRYIHQHGVRPLDTISRIVALWRGERDFGDKAKADEIERRVWGSMARVSQLEKEKERKEWQYIGELRERDWHTAHGLFCHALNSPIDEANPRLFPGVKRRRVTKPTPLSPEEEARWFSFESFLELWGAVGLNQEESGGLYALHAHVNHSCEPNLQGRNLPKSYTLPTADQLPCDLPPSQSQRGTNKLTFLARRTIHPGEELTLPYVNPAMPKSHRRQILREQYGFWCNCPKCQREKDDPKDSVNPFVAGADEAKAAELVDAIKAMSAKDTKTEESFEPPQQEEATVTAIEAAS